MGMVPNGLDVELCSGAEPLIPDERESFCDLERG